MRREGGGGTGLAGGEGFACHMGQGACDEICDGQTQGRFNKTRVMASACISAFQQAAKICVKSLITKHLYRSSLNRFIYIVYQCVISRLY